MKAIAAVATISPSSSATHSTRMPSTSDPSKYAVSSSSIRTSCASPSSASCFFLASQRAGMSSTVALRNTYAFPATKPPLRFLNALAWDERCLPMSVLRVHSVPLDLRRSLVAYVTRSIIPRLPLLPHWTVVLPCAQRVPYLLRYRVGHALHLRDVLDACRTQASERAEMPHDGLLALGADALDLI